MGRIASARRVRETFSRTRSHAIASPRGFVAIPLEIRFSTVLPRSYVLFMFVPMTDDTQTLRDANTPGGPGVADNTIWFKGTATSGARAPAPEEAGAP